MKITIEKVNGIGVYFALFSGQLEEGESIDPMPKVCLSRNVPPKPGKENICILPLDKMHYHNIDAPPFSSEADRDLYIQRVTNDIEKAVEEAGHKVEVEKHTDNHLFN